MMTNIKPAEQRAQAIAQATPQDLYTAYLADLDATDKTRRTYAAALRNWARWLETVRLGELEARREDVLAYRDHLKETRAASTVCAYLTALRSFYAWTEAQRIYPNIAAGVKGPRMNHNSAKDALTLEQARRVLDHRDKGLEGLRNAAMISLMMTRGLRTIEIVRADIGDIRQVSGEAVLYVQGKGYESKGDFVILSETCLRPIYEYLDARGETDPAAPLFASIGNRNAGGRMTTRSVSRIAKEALKEEGLSSARLTAHSLRHTAVTFALLGGATVQEAQAMARHSSISTTQIYAHNLDRMAHGAEYRVDAYLTA